MSLGEAEHRARVDPAAQVGGDLDIGDEPLADGVVEHGAETQGDVGVRTIIGRQLRGCGK